MDVKWNNVKSLNLQQKATTTANDQTNFSGVTYLQVPQNKIFKNSYSC